MDRKKIILIFSVLSAILVLIISIAIFNSLAWKAPLDLNNKFITTWGNYDYQNYDEYPESVRPLVTTDLYSDYFEGEENQQSYYIQQGKMITNKGKTETVIIKTLNKNKSGDKYVIKTQIKETITSSGTSSSNIRTATITITKSGDKYLVSEINYN